MIDLHAHTTASDGTSSPQALVAEALRVGLEVLAVTDHDTFEAVASAQEAAGLQGLRVIAGVEISTTLNPEARHLFPGSPRDIHLLAYFPQADVPGHFREWVKGMEASRWRRNRELLGRLEAQGVCVAEQELRSAGGSVAGRVHLARILVKRNLASSLDEAFRRFLGEAASCYVPRQSPPIAEAIARVRDAGGIASLAHPIRFWGHSWECADGLCAWLSRAGLHAMEVWHSEQDAAYSQQLRALAQRHHLRMTGGSDFHGDNKPDIQLATGHGSSPLVPYQELLASWADAPLSLV
jgi:predicted metal-dependent phosphoesterase TrpH